MLAYMKSGVTSHTSFVLYVVNISSTATQTHTANATHAVVVMLRLITPSSTSVRNAYSDPRTNRVVALQFGYFL